MAILGLTGKVRTPRWAIIRLGYKLPGRKEGGAGYPTDSDVFCIKPEGDPDVFKAIVTAYRGTRITGAAEEVYSLGRQLRMVFPWEFDAVHEGKEVSFELLNRSWNSAARLRCSGNGGDGGDNVGVAIVRDEAYAERLKRHGLLLGEKRQRGLTARCLGEDCPLHHTRRSKEDTLPGCHREMRLNAFLLHPDRSERLGWVEVASGSWHGALDVQSGLLALRADVGRTAGVPFTLVRIPHAISTPAGRAVKATLNVTYVLREAARLALSPGSLGVLEDGERQQLLQLAGAEVSFDQVADIQPQPERDARALPAPRETRPGPLMPEETPPALASATPSPDLQGKEREPGLRILTDEERDDLKRVCGGIPGRADTLRRFHELVQAAYHALGLWTPSAGRVDYQPEPGRPAGIRYLNTSHDAWIRAQLAAGPAAE